MLATLFAGSLAIALAGCGGSDGSGSAGTSATSSTTPTTLTDTAGGGGATSGTGSSAGGTGATTSGSTSGGGTTVPPASTSSVTLAWQPPTENTDGTLITNLAGYKIHYGTSSADYTQVVSITNAGLTRYVIENLAKGTYYFAIAAYNSQGLESPLSGEVTSTVN
jgi:hypothetical protein